MKSHAPRLGAAPRRDHAAWCPYCQKVFLQLEEKRIPYVIEKINMRCYGDKPRDFMAKVPSGLLPVLEYGGRIITESGTIMDLLEREFPDHTPLMPPRWAGGRAAQGRGAGRGAACGPCPARRRGRAAGGGRAGGGNAGLLSKWVGGAAAPLPPAGAPRSAPTPTR